MGHVYWEKNEIPIPGFGYINHNDGRVFIIEEQTGKRTVIGHATSSTSMHPNDTFRWLYPDLWELAYGAKNTVPHEVSAGMYALVLGASYKSGIYPMLHHVYGPQYGNAILDYAMYSMLDRSDTTQLFPERMREQVVFSKEIYSDSWYSELFEHKLTKEQHHQFKVEWIQKCKERGITKAWISIDGSNNDCRAQRTNLPEFGKPKSHNHCTIVSYIYAVDTELGIPITYFVNEGGVVDSKAFQQVITFMHGYGIETEGIILDRGFCTHDVVETILSLKLNYILMTPSDNYGHNQIYKEYAESIRWEPEYIVDDGAIFGISHEERLFGNHPENAILNLFFDGSAGSKKSIQLNKKIIAEKKKVEQQLKDGKKPVVESSVNKYLRIETLDGKETIICDFSQWKSSMKEKGFFSIASSQDLGAGEVLRLYGLRDVSESQYSVLKSQEGFDTTRVHYTPGINSKFHECFVASCLRAEIRIGCRILGLDTNVMIKKMNRIKFLLTQGGVYSFVKNITMDQADLLEVFSIQPIDFESFARDYNQRKSNPIISQIHSLPKHTPATKRKRGRPQGSKNKKTLKKEAQMIMNDSTAIAPKKRGRPVGSKDKKPRKRRYAKKPQE